MTTALTGSVITSNHLHDDYNCSQNLIPARARLCCPSPCSNHVAIAVLHLWFQRAHIRPLPICTKHEKKHQSTSNYPWMDMSWGWARTLISWVLPICWICTSQESFPSSTPQAAAAGPVWAWLWMKTFPKLCSCAPPWVESCLGPWGLRCWWMNSPWLPSLRSDH